mgnify:CR=1 FL=1
MRGYTLSPRPARIFNASAVCRAAIVAAMAGWAEKTKTQALMNGSRGRAGGGTACGWRFRCVGGRGRVEQGTLRRGVLPATSTSFMLVGARLPSTSCRLNARKVFQTCAVNERLRGFVAASPGQGALAGGLGKLARVVRSGGDDSIVRRFRPILVCRSCRLACPRLRGRLAVFRLRCNGPFPHGPLRRAASAPLTPRRRPTPCRPPC